MDLQPLSTTEPDWRSIADDTTGADEHTNTYASWEMVLTDDCSGINLQSLGITGSIESFRTPELLRSRSPIDELSLFSDKLVLRCLPDCTP